MKDFLSRIFIRFITFSYERIFHERMSYGVKSFIKNLSYVGFGTIIATIFLFTFNILAGRILGPSGYGEFTIIQSVAMFLYIPMLMALNIAMVKYNAEIENLKRQQAIISTTYFLVFFFTIISMIFYYLFSSQISSLFSVSLDVFYLSVVYAVLFIFYSLAISTLRSLHEMKKIALFQPVYAIIVLSAFLIFIFINFISFKSMIFSICLAYGITGGVILIFIRKYIRLEFDWSWSEKLAKYSAYAIIGAIAFEFYTNIDKILINMYMDIEDVGIYRVYYFASINIAGLFFGIFNVVYFPIISKYNNRVALFKGINKIIPYLFGFGLPFIFLSEFVILKLYGGKYPMDFSLMILFAIVSILIVYYGIYDWTFCSEGATGVKLVSLSTLIMAIINITLNVYLIPRIGLFGAISSTAITFVVGIYFLSLFKNRIL